MLYTTTGNLFLSFFGALSLCLFFFYFLCFCLFSDEFLAFDLFRRTSLALARRDWVTQSPHMWCAFQTHSRSLILFFSPAGRKEKHASRNERRRRKSFSFFFLSFLLSHPGLVFLFLFSPHLHLCRHAQKNLWSLPSCPSIYWDDERVWIRSGRVYGASIPGFVNEAEIRQPPPNDEVEKEKVFISIFCFEEEETRHRERLSNRKSAVKVNKRTSRNQTKGEKWKSVGRKQRPRVGVSSFGIQFISSIEFERPPSSSSLLFVLPFSWLIVTGGLFFSFLLLWIITRFAYRS